MRKTSYQTSPKASVSLSSLVERKPLQRRAMVTAKSTGFVGLRPDPLHGSDAVAVTVELADAAHGAKVQEAAARAGQHMERLDSDGYFWSADLGVDRARDLWLDARVARVQTKKRSQPTLEHVAVDVGVRAGLPAGGRQIRETGAGVLVGIVDSGFDLNHPMFRDASGAPRVVALLDQNTKREFVGAKVGSPEAIAAAADSDGHGTHVASIAAGSKVGQYEGIAPGAAFALVKTDWINIDRAVKWIFDHASRLGMPCVVNLSLGHHLGAHDGSDAQERLFSRLTVQPGRIIVVSAGNERGDHIHIGGRFHDGQTEEVRFDVLERSKEAPMVITAWYDEHDNFEGGLVTPTGQLLPFPALDSTDAYDASSMQIEVARQQSRMNKAVKLQITLELDPVLTRPRDLRGWALRFTCQRAVVGRLDAWVNNSGYAAFHEHGLREEARIVGLPGTGDGSITVASYVTASQWRSDAGPQVDRRVVRGRISPFSSLGPSRDGREKPDIAAPGQYVTAALSGASDLAGWAERADTNGRLVTIEGTSMAAPVATGVVALMLQKNPHLTLRGARTILAWTARRDAHSGASSWDPSYGFGKIDVEAALARL